MLCFIALGGNFAASLDAITQSLHLLKQTKGIFDLQSSKLYQTTPVSHIVQPSFLNAAASFKTDLEIESLFSILEGIERTLGKMPKEKNAPRLIDIDLLYYGQVNFKNKYLQVPHPRLHERLFVLAPLSDLMDTSSLMKNFKNINNEQVTLLATRLPYEKG